MQTAQLHDYEREAQHTGQIGKEKILQIRAQAHFA
jgi:hypothetical protein